jgi:hypothetical protein
MRVDAPDVVMTKSGLDLARVGKLGSASLDARSRDLLDGPGLSDGTGSNGLELLDDAAAWGDGRHLFGEALSWDAFGVFT